MSTLTRNQEAALKKLSREPIGFHFAENRSERAIFSALVLSGLARKSWNYGEWMYILTDQGVTAASTLREKAA